jgi:hypothetical protein
MQAGHLTTVVGAKTRFIRVVKLIPKVAAKDSKNKCLSVAGVTDPRQPAGKTRFIRFGGLRMSPWASCKVRFARFWTASNGETRFSSSRRLRSQADLLVAWGQNEVYPVSEAYGCPPGPAAKRGLPGSWPPLTRETRFSSSEGWVLKLICWSPRAKTRFIRFGGLQMSPWTSCKARFARFLAASDPRELASRAAEVGFSS